MGPDSAFRPVIDYANLERLASCKSVIIMSGKFVYDVQQLIAEKSADATVLLAIE